MTNDKVELLTDKISFLEKKINRIEELLLLIVEEKYLSEDEKKRIAEADDFIRNNEIEKLEKIKRKFMNSKSMNNISNTEVENRIHLLINTVKKTGYEEELEEVSRAIRGSQNDKMLELWDNDENEVWNNV
ncbi:MAG: hypothetical protein E3J43_00735 [Candidatus Heimdallarchaeota archaeon]|nr:MAG: hypothetical protein E3J43_00735 [Candidatus Heimdallarchaeota archaeon]